MTQRDGDSPASSAESKAVTKRRWSAKGISRGYPGRAAGNPPRAGSSGRNMWAYERMRAHEEDDSSQEPRGSAPPATPARDEEERAEQAETAGRARRAQPFSLGSREVPRGRTTRPAHRSPRLPGRGPLPGLARGAPATSPRPPVPPERPQGCSRPSLQPRHGQAALPRPHWDSRGGKGSGAARSVPHLRAGCRVPRPALTPAALPCRCLLLRCHRRFAAPLRPAASLPEPPPRPRPRTGGHLKGLEAPEQWGLGL